MKSKTKKQLNEDLILLRSKYNQLKESESVYRKMEEDLSRWSRELKERSKELDCFYGISNILVNKEGLAETIQSIVDLIPLSWQYSDITCARVIIKDKEYKTKNFRNTTFKQKSDIIIHGKKSGKLEICYLEARPESDEGPFLKAERSLIDAVAERIGKIFEHKRIEDELRNSQRKLRELLGHLNSIQEKERKRIAHEIHDEIGQALTVLKIDIRWLSKRLCQNDSSLTEKILSIEKLVDQTIRNIQRISSELSPVLLDHFGLSEAIIWQTDDFQEHTGIKCQVSITPHNIVLEKDYSTALYRIIQELLTNVARHANATKVKINLNIDNDGLTLSFSDNGKGIDSKHIYDRKSFGIHGIQESVYFWGGSIKIKGDKNKGTTILIKLPVDESRTK